jgi:asparaginyl-tRNA synthetase
MYFESEVGMLRKKAILRIKERALIAARTWLSFLGFVEVNGPILLPDLKEMPRNFQVNYFNQKAYLSSGFQPYSDILVEMFEKVYTVAPAFRAEPLKTNRHLSEFWRIEVVASGLNLEQILKVQEELVVQICQFLVKECFKELIFLRHSISSLQKLESPFPRVSYDEAVKMLQRAKFRIHWGETLDWKMQKALSLMYEKPLFVKEFPVSGETILNRSHPEKPELSLCADLLAPEGYGEISSAGEFTTDKRELLKKVRELQINKADRRWYLSLRRFHDENQSGFAIGIERLLQWICALESVKEAAAFPRTFDSFYP